MFRATFAAGVVVVIGVALLTVSPSFSQQEKVEPAPVAKGQLPKYYSKLGLSDDQKQKLYAIKGTYSPKIEGLTKQINTLKAQQKAEQERVLTDDQKVALRRILLEKAPAAGDSAAPPKKADN